MQKVSCWGVFFVCFFLPGQPCSLLSLYNTKEVQCNVTNLFSLMDTEEKLIFSPTKHARGLGHATSTGQKGSGKLHCQQKKNLESHAVHRIKSKKQRLRLFGAEQLENHLLLSKNLIFDVFIIVCY